MRYKYSASLLMASVLLASQAHADSLHYNIVNLQDAAQMKVAQNQLTVNVLIESKAKDRQQASSDNTLKLNRVLQSVKAQGLQGQLLNRSVNQQYEYVNQSNRATGWLDEAQVSVTGEDTAKINQWVASVQQDARLSSQQYGLTEALKRQYVAQVTETALSNFQQQAQRISTSLGGKRYKIVELSISEDGHYIPQPRMLMAKADMAVAAAAPVAEDLPGEAMIQVQVRGKIQVH